MPFIPLYESSHGCSGIYIEGEKLFLRCAADMSVRFQSIGFSDRSCELLVTSVLMRVHLLPYEVEFEPLFIRS